MGDAREESPVARPWISTWIIPHTAKGGNIKNPFPKEVIYVSRNMNDDDPEGYERIFCRYRRDRSGKVLDAHAYGLKCWSFLVKRDK